MASNDPFAFLGRTKVSRETVASLEAQRSGESVPVQEKDDPFAFLGSKSPLLVGFSEAEGPDIGVIGSFGAGVKKGILEPITFIRGHSEVDPRIDEASEQVSEFLGSMVGLGISFIPIAKVTGLVLGGVGIVAGETVASKAAFGFLRNVIAGSAQFAGTSEKLEDIPKNLAIGAGFGGAIEGVFLVRAMRSRALTKGVGKLLDTGSPHPDVPVGAAELSIENALSPTDAKSPERLIDELIGLRNPELTTEQVLSDLARTHETTINLFGLKNADDVVNYAKNRLEGAQILRRKILGGEAEDVLIHNPVDPRDKLSPKQIAQWQATRFYEGQAVEYRGKTYMATGEAVVPGRIQVKNPYKPHIVFAPSTNEVSVGTLSKVFSSSSEKLRELTEYATLSADQIGFAIRSAEEGSARRGVVDTSEFETVSSLRQFMNENRVEILKFEAPSAEEATKLYAASRGIKGLVEKEAGIATKVHVFDQSTVSFQHEVPRLGIEPDAASVLFEKGNPTQLISFTPSWKNTIVGALRAQDIPEKQIQEFLDLQRGILGRRAEDLMDDEFKGIIKSSELQFGGGCR